jgi:hypothetical protein
VKVYTTSAAAGSVGAGVVLEEGAKALGAGVLEEGAEVPGAGVEEVGAGRMRDTSLGAHPFAFLKNSFISARGQA